MSHLPLFFRHEPKRCKKKREVKRKFKKSVKTMKSKPYVTAAAKRNGGKPLLDGVSIFELIMPWKADAIRQSKPTKKGNATQQQTSLTSFMESTKSKKQ